MKEHWLEVLEWIQLAITLAFLVVMAGILVLVLRYHKLEFNVLWKTRAFIVSIAIMWAFSLLLGRQQLWSPNDGLLSSSSSKFEGLCRAHVFLTFGIWQPLFFITILMVLRSKERSKLDLYSDHPNKLIIYNSLLWCVPIFVAHIVFIALGAVNESNPLVWATYTSKYHHCVIPILSTTAFAAFYCCFILFYIISSRKLFTRLLNHNLRNRIRWTQFFFVFFFPVEIVVRFIMIFISKYERPYEALYHTYFFMDLIVCSVAVSELVLLPVLDAASYPLLAGVTAQACINYEKSEQMRRHRKSTRTIQPLRRGVSAVGMEAGGVMMTEGLKQADYKHVELKDVELKDTSLAITSDSPVSFKSTSSVKRMPSLLKQTAPPEEVKPMLHLSTSTEVERQDWEDNKNSSLHVKAPVSAYPTDLEDIFADIDDVGGGEGSENSSLKLKVDSLLFISDDYPSTTSSSSQHYQQQR